MTPLAAAALVATAGLATGADITLSLIGFRIGFREANPLMRVLGRVGMCAFGWAATVGTAYAALTSAAVWWLAAALAIGARGWVTYRNWRLVMGRIA